MPRVGARPLHASADKRHLGQITKQGNALLRMVLVQGRLPRSRGVKSSTSKWSSFSGQVHPASSAQGAVLAVAVEEVVETTWQRGDCIEQASCVLVVSIGG